MTNQPVSAGLNRSKSLSIAKSKETSLLILDLGFLYITDLDGCCFSPLQPCIRIEVKSYPHTVCKADHGQQLTVLKTWIGNCVHIHVEVVKHIVNVGQQFSYSVLHPRDIFVWKSGRLFVHMHSWP